MQAEVRDETYQGWANYPTWAVNLWLANDEGLYRETLELVSETLERDHPTSDYWTEDESRRYGVADMLKDYASEMWVHVDAGHGGTESFPQIVGLHADLLGWALSHVNWDEIAIAWIEMVDDR